MTRGLWVLGGVALVVLLAPLAAPYAPDAIDLANRRAGPSLSHWFGTDDLGRDAFSRALFGGRVSMAIGLLSAVVAVAMGVTAGAVAAYAGGWADSVLMRVTDAMLAVPRLLLLMVAAAALQPSIPALVVLVGAVGWMETARVTRTSVRGLLGAEFVAAARAAGAGHLRLLTRHLLANASGAIRTAAVLAVARAVLVESALSFFGVGVQPPDASWGTLIADGARVMALFPWLVIFPGLALSLTLLAFNFLGDGLRDALDPRQR